MTQTLYYKYGGFKTVSSVVQRFYQLVLASETLAPYFASTDMARLIHHQTRFISTVMGGPEDDLAVSLRTAHARLNIEHQAFAQIGALLQQALEEHGVEQQDVATMLEKVTALMPEIVR